MGHADANLVSDDTILLAELSLLFDLSEGVLVLIFRQYLNLEGVKSSFCYDDSDAEIQNYCFGVVIVAIAAAADHPLLQ